MQHLNLLPCGHLNSFLLQSPKGRIVPSIQKELACTKRQPLSRSDVARDAGSECSCEKGFAAAFVFHCQADKMQASETCIVATVSQVASAKGPALDFRPPTEVPQMISQHLASSPMPRWGWRMGDMGQVLCWWQTSGRHEAVREADAFSSDVNYIVRGMSKP